MKTRVNSKINNTRGKATNSFKTKKQGYKSEALDKAVGYCSFHQVNIGKKLFKIKKCNKCERFIEYVRKEIKGDDLK